MSLDLRPHFPTKSTAELLTFIIINQFGLAIFDIDMMTIAFVIRYPNLPKAHPVKQRREGILNDEE
jgi:hypothetical protein